MSAPDITTLEPLVERVSTAQAVRCHDSVVAGQGRVLLEFYFEFHAVAFARVGIPGTAAELLAFLAVARKAIKEKCELCPHCEGTGWHDPSYYDDGPCYHCEGEGVVL